MHIFMHKDVHVTASCSHICLTITIHLIDKDLSSFSGPGSSVSIATAYRLDSLGSNPSGDKIFRPSIPALWPIQPPVKWVPGLSRG